MTEFTCQECGETAQQKRKDQKFCSSSCHTTALNQRYKRDPKYRQDHINKARQHYLLNKEKIRNQQIERKNKDPNLWLLNKARSRAKAKGIPFNIQKEDITIPKVCPILGVELTIGSRRFHSESPTVDRIDSNKGYTKDNIQVISHRANSLKSNASLEELIRLGEWAKYHLQKDLNHVTIGI